MDSIQKASDPNASALIRAVLAASAAVLLTAIHHAYGAAVYAATFRKHIVFFILPTGFMIAALLSLGWRSRSSVGGRYAIVIGVWMVLVLLGGGIGVIEGGYNHLLKNLLYFSHVPQQLMYRLYPAPAYEMPNDWFFEVTGILQLFVGLLAGREALRLAASLQLRWVLFAKAVHQTDSA